MDGANFNGRQPLKTQKSPRFQHFLQLNRFFERKNAGFHPVPGFPVENLFGGGGWFHRQKTTLLADRW